MEFSQYHQSHHVQLCVIGGGLSGLFAAVSAARRGAKVLLMHDRPVLGGNASSEIRMWVRGAAGKENRESGLIQEERPSYDSQMKMTQDASRYIS